MRTQENGFTLLELILAVSLVTLGTVLSLQSKTADMQIGAARIAGQTMLQYSNAVRKWILLNPGKETEQVGSQWLKPSSCGGFSSVGLLPCNFPTVSAAKPLQPGLMTFTTSIKAVGSGADQSTIANITVSPFKVKEPQGVVSRFDLSGVVALTVAAGGSGSNQPIYSSTTLMVNSSPTTGIIVITARARPFDEAWLRIDGKNNLHQALVMGGPDPSTRMLLGVNRIQAQEGERLHVGGFISKTSSLLPALGSGVIVDAELESFGRINSNKGVLSDGLFSSTESALVVKNADIKVIAGKTIATKFIDADDNNFFLAPDSDSKLNKLAVSGRIVVNGDTVFKGVVTEGEECEVSGAMASSADHNLMSCRDAKWSKISDLPRMYRFTFTKDSSWVVPAGVTSAQVSLAGGGGSGQGWRSSSVQSGGPSGGYLFNEPVPLVAGETISIEVGKGAISFKPTNPPTNVTVAGGQNYWYQAPIGDLGAQGHSGTSSKIISPSLGTILECAGGSGSSIGGIDHFSGPLMPGGIPGIGTGSGIPAYPLEQSKAPGPFANPGGPGACGHANKGIGNSGQSIFWTAGGMIKGGDSPFGYGSGGNTTVEKGYVTYDTMGQIILCEPGRDGIVYIDIIY